MGLPLVVRKRLIESLRVFERQMLAFPLLVVSFASIAFLCGGACAPWQWWSALAIVLILPYFAITPPHSAFLADLIFVATLLGIFFAVYLFSDPATLPDMAVCHLPAIRMLIEGWNPVYDSDATAIISRLGLADWDMRYFHVIFMKNFAWVFSAVSYFFFGNPFAHVSIPGYFLEISMFLAAGRLFRALAWRRSLFWTAFFAVAVKLAMGQSAILGALPLDQASMYAIGAMLLVQTRCIATGAVDPFALFATTFAAAAIKPAGIYAALISWLLFGAAFVARYKKEAVRGILRRCAWFAGFAVLFVAVQFHPYVTSYVKYGHPLYPAATGDAKAHPAMDLTWDFMLVNDDYRQMSAPAKWINAYVSPSLVKWHYNRKLGRNDFYPMTWCWKFTSNGDYPGPLLPDARIALWLAIGVLALCRPFRLMAVFFLLTLVVWPPDMYGYNRYFPYMYVLEGLALTAAAKYAMDRNRAAGTVFAGVCVAWCGAAGLRTTVQRLLYTSHISEGLPNVIYTGWRENSGAATQTKPYGKLSVRVETPPEKSKGYCWERNNIKLLLRLVDGDVQPRLACEADACPYTEDEIVRVPGYFIRPKTDAETALSKKPRLTRVFSYLKADLRLVFCDAPLRMLRAVKKWRLCRAENQ